MRRLGPAILIAVLVGMAACSPPPPPSSATVPHAGYTNISADELSKMLAKKDFTLVNVHVPFQGNIPGTDLAIPYDKVDQYLDKLPDKKARIVLYCNGGPMSRTASERLVELGYTNIYNLQKGFSSWQAAGYPLTQDPPFTLRVKDPPRPE